MQKTQDIRIEDFNYPLPDEKIAKFPLSRRDESKLLIYCKGNISETIFKSLPDRVPTDSLLVFNNTRVIQARLHFRKETGALIEIFCLEPSDPHDYVLSFQATSRCSWICMIGNLKKWKTGALKRTVRIGDSHITLSAERKSTHGNAFEVEFSWDNDHVTFDMLLERIGELPIPPYLNRETEESDKETYQTVYSKIEGSVAAPTAGLHFTTEVLSRLHEIGIPCLELTLHVGAGTFRPVKSETIKEHEMHTEFISVSRAFIETLLESGRKIIAVGTTSVRTLESLYYIGRTLESKPDATAVDLPVKQWQPYDGSPEISPDKSLRNILCYLDRIQSDRLVTSTQIIIAPGYTFKLVKGMITNFHQPQSTLLLLVSAFVDGRWREIYDYALSHEFRFLSYGDSSLLMP
ncbi:S-adenosylmethionine:tRNA ribosyltransferase-isomerase [Coprobacter tertius]|uniref:S-adenosylmethionine:tRNA ribosyltransferase-isomerase n=1 Tax=Coprobacter tertius TaxID=2944915 RepID=A0ABT1MI83_9BACT|nr:S-adenosylmethionine:tRNA ribosyltransferase-isomerase [Coprobacter tertius]MCP9612322.1 S-adenosylmethionine:tRNA ribosyltransferase-isomerase [Coprobacter tertius]